MKAIQKILILILFVTFYNCSNNDDPTPTDPTVTTTSTFKMVSTSGAHTIAIKTDGTLWSWGQNITGVLGIEGVLVTYKPLQIGTANDWAYVDTGSYFNLAIKTNGTLWAWGSNAYYGNIGDNTTVQKNVPIQIGTATNWTKVSAGNRFSLAINSNGDLYGWGRNSENQIGGTATTSRPVPTLINSNNYVAISAGDTHSLALTASGALYSWGSNIYGELGLANSGSGTNRLTPTLVSSTTPWRSVSAGNNLNVGIKTDGSIWVWGDNVAGYLGLGNTSSTNIPTRIGTGTNWKLASAGEYSFLATKTDNTLWSWGLNSRGQLGSGSTTNISTPTQVGTGTNWTFLSLSTSLHSFAIQSNNSLWGSGANNSGQLGNNTTLDNYSFININ